MRRLLSFLGVIACAFAAPAFAQSTTNQTMDDCKLIPDDAARLACYDRVIKAGRADIPGPSNAGPQVSQGGGGGGGGGTGGAGSNQGTAPQMTAEERREAKKAAFGVPGYAAPKTKQEQEEEVTEVTGQIASVGVAGPNLLRVTTAEGQTWDQTEGVAARAKVGDTITIKENFMGGMMCKIGSAAPYRCIRADRPGQS